MKIFSILLIAVCLLLQSGCGPTNAEVIKKYQPDYQKKRDQLKQIAGILPSKATSSGSAACKTLNPQILIDKKNKKYNAESVMFEQLSAPDEKPEFDLLIYSDLLNSIQWTGPKNPLSSTNMDDNGENMEKSMKESLAYSYLIVNRIAQIAEPEVISKENYTPGNVTIETFIVDLKENKVICGFTTAAKSMPSLSGIVINQTRTEYAGRGYRGKRYVTIKAQPELVQLQSAANSSMWEDSRSQIIAKLKELTGAAIEVN